MTTYTIKNLYQGQLPVTKSTLYTVPAGTVAIIRSTVLVNTNTTAEVVNLYIKTAVGVSRRICPKDLSLPAGAMLTSEVIYTLGAGDLIEGSTTTVSMVDCSISGVEGV